MTTDPNPELPSNTLVTLPDTLVLRMKANDETYRISIALPVSCPTPPSGFPVIYLLDANACFATVAETQRRLSRRPDATGVQPAVVVGIGPDVDDLYDVRSRQRDFTSSAPASDPGMQPNQTGGAKDFLGFIQQQLQPAIQRRFPVDQRRQILAGHSLAAYFALWVLVRHTATFHAYIAISPSLWWDDTLCRDITGIGARPRVFLAVGEWEQILAPWQGGQQNSRELLARRSARRMVSNAREFADALGAHLGPELVRFRLFPEEDHASVFATAISRAMRFVL